MTMRHVHSDSEWLAAARAVHERPAAVRDAVPDVPVASGPGDYIRCVRCGGREGDCVFPQAGTPHQLAPPNRQGMAPHCRTDSPEPYRSQAPVE
ncbi:hypothetical protein GCM10012286_79720 [Streptomyces lasiicapitis]|uniref:Uncharacterized protein n=1 Tax=Streptomyces lasiicapitis TaxID=1923961 RepID=A0ABQ2MUU9_9ACTN|nr:hypothetical protein GCM10012286_79720 [Streptomyces lasiicapitis]